MANKNLMKDRLKGSFKSTVEIKSQRDEIKDLQAKIALLDREAQERESLLSQLRLQLEQQSGRFSVAIVNIQPSVQCRQTFPAAVVNKRVESLRSQGQLKPLILIAVSEPDGIHQIEDGELTWRAACKLVELGETQWQYLTAVFSNLTPEDNIHRRTLIHHLHSENLTPLDRAEGLVRELIADINLEKLEIIKLLRNTEYCLRKSASGKELWDKIEAQGIESCNTELTLSGVSEAGIKAVKVLRDFQVNLTSFVANDLDTLLLADDLKSAVRTGRLSCRQAKILNQLSSKKLYCNEEQSAGIRLKATQDVMSSSLSISQTRTLVSDLIKQHQPEKPSFGTTASTEAYKNAKDTITKLSLSGLKSRQLKSLKLTMEKKLLAVNEKLSELEG